MKIGTKKTKLLDLFCGAGGAAMGYHRAGFDHIVGIDNRPQKNYPFEFIQADALEYLAEHGSEFDAIHASPPCQAYSNCRTRLWKDSPKLIPQTRFFLELSKRPYVIENVVGAPLQDIPLFGANTIMLCGASFGLGVCGFDLNRHRLFESDIPLCAPACRHRRGQTIGVYGNGTCSFHRAKFGRCVTVAEMREAMGIDWMTRKELSQAIPPAYTQFIGERLVEYLQPAIIGVAHR